MLDSIYHKTLKILKSHRCAYAVNTMTFYTILQWTPMSNVLKSINHFWLTILLHSVMLIFPLQVF